MVGGRGKRTTAASGSEPAAKKTAAAKTAAANGTQPAAAAAKKNKTDTDWDGLDFSSTAKGKNGESWNLKICSWNVDGLRACASKGGGSFLKHESPDIVCLQETKVGEGKVPAEFLLESHPHRFWLPAKKDGYAGVGLLTKEKPLHVTFGLESEEHDDEGRLITAEFPTFYLICVYVPNAGRGLVTLDKRLDWDPKFREFAKGLDAKKPLIICGDMNVSHKEIDLKNPKTNTKNAGFTKEEREGFTQLLEAGFVDSFRHFYPGKEGAYTFWTYMMNCRAKNVGWRLDYVLVSERLTDNLVDCIHRDQVFGSDHCPITLLMQRP